MQDAIHYTEQAIKMTNKIMKMCVFYIALQLYTSNETLSKYNI